MQQNDLNGSGKQLVASDLPTHSHFITFFPDEYAASKDEEAWTLPDLAGEIRDRSAARKTRLPFLKLARFGETKSRKNCLRTDANTVEVTGLEIDYDDGVMPFDDAIKVMKDACIRSLLYTSASYIKGVKEKWRILAPFSKGYPAGYREEMVAVVNGLLGGVAGEESFRLSQSFYYGSIKNNPEHRVEVIDGDFVDLRPDLLAGAIGKQGNGAAKARIVLQDRKQGSASAHPVSPGRDEAEILTLITESRKKNPHGGGQWHNSMLQATASMVGAGWSNAEIYAACAPYCDGQWGDEEIAELIEGARAKWGVADPGTVIAKIAPVVAAAIAAKGGVGPEFEPNWRERYVNGRPKASLHNVRLAIEKTGLQCSSDIFHNKAWIGRSDAAAPVEPLAAFIGEVSDSRIGALRMYLSDRFGIDFTEKHVRDAIGIMCHENRFDPVCNMLAEAEAGWDGVERLGRMAVDYFNCADTALNRQCVRKTMIAAVKRAREPGCKFDTILTMESREGWNKSSAWAVLAGEGNFSDERILGRESREVQETLAGIWIHENADLAGMRKADVDAVKSFASRQVDRARPAYGHFLVEQKRHSIEVGTTNADRYLLSQTGNRRFWPIRVLAPIDLARLRQMRLQLWGEAAQLQSRGESLVLDEQLWGAAAIEQEARRAVHPWEALLAAMTDVPSGPIAGFGYIGNGVVHTVNNEQRVASWVIFEHVVKVPIGQLHIGHSKTVAEIMRRLGWEESVFKLEGKAVRGYTRNPKKGI